MKKQTPPRSRRYRQTARASAAEATGERIIESVLRRVQTQWYEEVTLDDVAKDAGVTVQTVIRRFGGKDQLLEAASAHVSRQVVGRREVASGDLARAVDVLAADYETAGELFWRVLAQEDRYPVLRAICDRGRVEHRKWVRHVCEPWLDGLDAKGAAERLDGLVAATDLYLWKLLRRDLRRSLRAYKATVLALLTGVLPADASPAERKRGAKRTTTEEPA